MPRTSDVNGTHASQSDDTFRRLYEESFAPVWSYAVSRVGRQAAEDLVSETFAVAWRRRDSLPADPLPWLIRVARNLAFESFRVGARQRLLETELQGGAALDRLIEPDIADSVIIRHQALTALATLSERDRELLMLIAWQGLSPRQAAKVLGCSRATFFVRLHRARVRLEHALSPQVSASEADASTSRFVHPKEVSR